MRHPEIRNHIQEYHTKFLKFPDRYEMRRDGRWGPTWLHRLVWRIALNLGMISHPTVDESFTTWRPIPVKRLGEYAAEASLAYLEQDFYRDDLVIYAGRDMFKGFMTEMVSSAQYWQVPLAVDGRHRYLDMPIYIIPQMTGALVVPRPERIR